MKELVLMLFGLSIGAACCFKTVQFLGAKKHFKGEIVCVEVSYSANQKTIECEEAEK
jgi:hypothetical protein